MAHTFGVWTESPASVGRIHAAFGREDYWLARLSRDAVTTLDSLTVDPDGTVAVRLTQRVGRQLPPALVSQVVPADVKLRHRCAGGGQDPVGGRATGETHRREPGRQHPLDRGFTTAWIAEHA